MDSAEPATPGEKAKAFPHAPGVYLMKDAQGVVIYIGKAKDLRDRAASYFTAIAAEDRRTAELVKHICDIECIQTESEVDALLLESRLIKDTQPRFNSLQKDDKSFPYLQIRTREEYPRVEFTRKPRSRGVRLYGPFTSARSLRMAIQVLQRILQFRTCSLDIKSSEERWRWYRPCILHNIRQCTAPCNFRVTREDYRKQIRSLCLVLGGKKEKLIREMDAEMHAAAGAMLFEKAARIRDEIAALRKLEMRGEADKDIQPHVFHINPRKGMKALQKVLGLRNPPRVIEGMDIAHLQGSETVASMVSFIDGTPFRPGYRRFKIQSVAGIDDYASMREVVFRRFRRLRDEDGPFPDILLIDGGKGQLNAAMEVFPLLEKEPPCVISLAKQEEEIFRPGEKESIKLSKHSQALRLLQSVRDESHRFAQAYHHLLRKKKMKGE